MRIPAHPSRRPERGYITVILVLSVALVASALMTSVFRATLRSQDTQKVAQVRVDVDQRESAILRAILAIAPNRTIQAMSANSSLAPTPYRWQTIFTEAIALANAANADVDGVGASVAAGARTSNAADFTGSTTNIFRAASGTGVVFAGVNSRPYGAYPDFLVPAPGATVTNLQSLDATYPIITYEKIYQDRSFGGPELDTTLYPVFNRIPYPNIRFGYAQPGDKFVAKRNWYAFSIRYPISARGVPRNRKQYILSIYEVPTQVALSASTFMSLGRHDDGPAWQGIQINGSVFADRILAEKTLAINRMSSRTGIDIMASPVVGGTNVPADFDSDDTVQSFESKNTGFYPVSVAAASGRVAFIPLNRGLDFYRFTGTVSDANRLSPTSWNDYSIGALQCAIKVSVTGVLSADDQTPQQIVVKYKKNGGDVSTTLQRGNNWPFDNETGGTSIPFQTELTETGRNCLTLHVNRLQPWLSALGASGPDINHSVAINPDPSFTNVRAPEFPSNPLDMGVVLRGGSDLTAYTKGFSLVANVRLFFADDLNTVTTATPAGSGLTTSTFTPPIAIYAPEKRWGTTSEGRFVKFRGQLWNPGLRQRSHGPPARPADRRNRPGGRTESTPSSARSPRPHSCLQ